jgi:hypothetical protein
MTTSVFWQTEDDLSILANGRRPQYLGKWKTTSTFLSTEADLVFVCLMEDELNFCSMEDNLNCFKNRRRPQLFFLRDMEILNGRIREHGWIA